MRRIHIAVATAITLAIAGTAAATSNPVTAVAHHSTYTQIILWQTGEDAGEQPQTLAGLVTCPEGGWLHKLVRQIQRIPACHEAGFLYAYPSWAGEPWHAQSVQVLGNRLEVDDTGRLWSTVQLRYVPAAIADDIDGPAIADAFAVQIQDPRPGPGGQPINYHLTLDPDQLVVHPGGLAALALGVGPAPT